MDNDKKLFEELLKTDGIDPKAVTESERQLFKKMLDTEQKRVNRLSWVSAGFMWVFALVLIALNLSENLLERLHIPFAVPVLAMAVAWCIIMLRYMPGHNKKLEQSNRKISKLYYLVNGKNRGLTLVGKKDGKRHIYWLRIIMIATGLWLIMSLGGAGVFYLLCQRWIYASGPNLHIFYCTVFSLSFVIYGLRSGFKAPLDELTEEKTKQKRSKPGIARHGIWRFIMTSKITKFAAVAVIIIGIFLFFDKSQRTLYAQIVKAIENAQTIHVATESFKNGQWSKSSEVWYGSDNGIVETSWSNGERTDIRIDNGQYRWIYNAGNNFAKRSKSIDPIGVARKILNTEAFKEKAIREPNRDMFVDGTEHFAYILSNPENTWRMISWLDKNSQIRGWEKSRLLENGQWEKYRIGKVSYNIKLDPKLFLPDFGEDVEIFNVDKKLDAFALEDAIFAKEQLGLVFAVHELVRCDEGLIFAVSTIRPADAWKDAAREESSRYSVWYYGDFSFGSSWRQLDNYGRGHSYQPIRMAEVHQADLQVQWTLFLPQGFNLEEEDKCELEVYMHTRGELSKQREKAGLPTRERYKPMAVLDLPNESTALNTVLNQIYLTASVLEPFVAHNRLTLKSIPFTDEEMDAYIKEHPDSGETREYRSGDKSNRLSHGQASKPSEINKDDWIKDRLDYLEELDNRHNEFLKEVKKREMRDQK